VVWVWVHPRAGPTEQPGEQNAAHDKRAQLYAFDMLAGDGEDYRGLPLSLRKRNLARLLRRRVAGIFPAEFDVGEIAYDLFGAACHLGLEGIVSKRCDRAYGAGKCRYWVKVKNPAHPAYSRVRDQLIQYRVSRASSATRSPQVS
jgi:bifunctional non-homologous end joining protein LigD